MPSPPEPLLDERYDELVEALRAARPHASTELRERVRALAAEPEPGRRESRSTLRPRALVPAFLVVLLVGAAVVGVLTRDGGRVSGDGTLAQRQQREPSQGYGAQKQQNDALAPAPQGAQEAQEARARAALPPSRTRLQDYRAELRLRVPNLRRLSSATARAMRATRS
nr:hypothetical protein [Actinomycetota bacterium]